MKRPDSSRPPAEIFCLKCIRANIGPLQVYGFFPAREKQNTAPASCSMNVLQEETGSENDSAFFNPPPVSCSDALREISMCIPNLFLVSRALNDHVCKVMHIDITSPIPNERRRSSVIYRRVRPAISGPRA